MPPFALKNDCLHGPKVAFYFLKMWKLAARGPIRAAEGRLACPDPRPPQGHDAFEKVYFLKMAVLDRDLEFHISRSGPKISLKFQHFTEISLKFQ